MLGNVWLGQGELWADGDQWIFGRKAGQLTLINVQCTTLYIWSLIHSRMEQNLYFQKILSIPNNRLNMSAIFVNVKLFTIISRKDIFKEFIHINKHPSFSEPHLK